MVNSKIDQDRTPVEDNTSLDNQGINTQQKQFVHIIAIDFERQFPSKR